MRGVLYKMEDNIIIQDLKKIKEFISNTNLNNFFVIADFGRTFTKCFLNNKKISTSFAIIRNEGYLGEEYIQRAQTYFDEYHPIEIDANRSSEEKIKPLTEWWKLHMELLGKYGFSLDIIKELIQKGKFPLRDGSLEFFDLLHEREIPIVIISQGLGDIYIEALKNAGRFYDNIYFVSNLFEFNDDEKVVGFKDTIVHPYNKSEIDLSEFDFFNKIKDKQNILLLGDSLEDVEVINNLNYDNLIKIGFLNEKISENIDEYKKNFDVLILNDSDFDYINNLIKKIH